MKKILATISLVVLVLMPVKAQISLGVKAGLNITKMSMVSEVLSSSRRCGFFIGPTAKFSLPIVGLGIDASVLYNERVCNLGILQQATEYSGMAGSKDITHKSVSIPVNVRYQFLGLGDNVGIFIFTGPQIDFTIGDKNILHFDQYKDWTFHSSDFSWNLGGGVMLLSHFQLSLNYNIGLTKTGSLDESVAEIFGFSKSYEHTWQIGAVYYF